MNKCVLIQANGNGERMREYFDIPKHHVFYKGDRIVNHIIKYIEAAGIDYYIATKYDENINNENIIKCGDTNNRLETLKCCIPYLMKYDSVIVHDCDVIFNTDCIKSIQNDMLSISSYKNDGMKYGFVSVDCDFSYVSGNEKTKEESFITTGIYSFDVNNMIEYLNNNPVTESLLSYYNLYIPKLYYTKEHINLGDIKSYMNQL